MNQDKALSMIGLAMKAGKVVSGEFATEKATKQNRASLVVVAMDASENTKKKFTNMCAYYQVPMYFLGDKETLGKVVGKEFRACLAVLDKGFAGAVKKQMNDR